RRSLTLRLRGRKMTPQQSSRVKKLAALVVVVVAAFFVFDWARWWVFETRIHNVLLAVPHQPTVADVVRVRSKVLDEARSLCLRPSSIELKIRLEQHTSNGYALKEDQLECYW